MRKQSYYIFLITSIFSIAVILFCITYTYRLIENNEDHLIILHDFRLNGKPDDFHTRYLSEKEQSNIYNFETTIPGKDFKRLNSEYYKIILFQISGNSYRVYFNETLIGNVGDFDNKRSYIWNSINSFDINKHLVKDINKLSIVINPSYKIGKAKFPLLITESAMGYKIYSWINVVFLSSFSLLLNMFIFTSLFFLVLMITLKRYNKQTVFYLHATLFASFYLLNYITLCNLPVSIAFFKKFQYISLFAGTYFASLAIYNQYHKKINKIVSLALVPAIFLILIQSGVYTVTNILNVLPFLNLLSWLYPCFLNFRKNYGARTLLFASILLAICIGYDYLTVLTKEYNVIRSSNYGILFFCLAFMLLSYDYYLEYQNSFVRLTTEAVKEKEKLHKLAYTDGLTSLLNNTYLHEYFSLLVKGDCLTILFCDIDNFKNINDSLGHLTGNLILKEVSNILKEISPLDSLVFRYGGDEFVILMENYDKNFSLIIAQKIIDAVNNSDVIKSLAKGIPVTVTIGCSNYPIDGDTPEGLIDKADKAMYYGKVNGRNQCNCYKREMT